MPDKSPKAGRLFVVATPLGNLEDITLRALRVLKEVDLIAAEDTRVAHKLLSHYSISTPTTSFHEHSPPAKLRQLVAELRAGKDIALTSDAGLPGISDPGEKLVTECLAHGVEVVAVPGPSAAITALAVSGLPTGEFTFIGFIPRRGTARREVLASLAEQPRTLVIFEAPHRLLQTLADLRQAFGNRRAVAARELTKKFEQIIRGRLEELAAHFTAQAPRGEITLVVEGAPAESAPERQAREQAALPEALAQARELMAQGASTKEAARQVATQHGLSRRAIYNALLENSARPG